MTSAWVKAQAAERNSGNTTMSILDDDAVVDGIRRVLQSAGGADATAVLRDFGVVDLLREDRAAATEHVFYEQGRLGTHSHAYTDLQDAVLASHFPGLEGTVPMSLSGGIGTPLGRFGDGTATGVGYTFGRPADLVFMVSEGPQNIAVAVACAGPGVTLEQVHGIDPTLELWKVTVTRVPAEIVAVDDAALAWWLDAVAWGRLAFAWELVGSARTMLDQAVDHARNRVQFGRPRRWSRSKALTQFSTRLSSHWIRSLRRRRSRSPVGPLRSLRRTACRCWAASASPPSTPSTGTYVAEADSTSCSAPARI